MDDEAADQIQIAKSQAVYGVVVHWITIASALIAFIAPVLMLWRPERNVLNPNYIFEAIWRGEPAGTIWRGADAGFPGGHFYLEHITTGDGLAQFGIALGCSVAAWALMPAVVSYLREGDYFYAGIGVLICLLIFAAMFGL